MYSENVQLIFLQSLLNSQNVKFCASLINELDRHPFNGLFFQDNLGKPAPER